MVGALWTGISGLSGSQTGLDNESNNIANVNTIGFKASRVSFADQVYQDKIGKGVTSFDIEKTYTQGNLKVTGVSYDMALSGDGFFQLSDGNDTYYSRAGNFRMGESGTLQDVGQNEVQGWAVSEISSDDIVSTDPNSSFFTSEYSKVLGNKVIRDTTTIETIATKATDYNASATSDSNSIYTGAGYKSASTKKADVEALITQYNAALSVYAEADPKPTSSSSSTQKDLLNFSLTGTDLDEGDEVYAYIDGVKYSTSWETDNETTMKNFADVISDTTGFRAYLTDNATSPYVIDTETAPELGFLIIEGLLPGESYTVSEFGWTDSSNDNTTSKGDVINLGTATLGTGMGHIESIEEALEEAVAGKQMDVYDDLAFDNVNDYTYQISIYDEEQNGYVDVPAAPGLTVSDPADLDELVAAINADADLDDYIVAYNINGNLVVKTNDTYKSSDFTGTMSGPISDPTAEEQSLTVSAATATANSTLTVTLNGDTYSVAVSTGDTVVVQAQAIYDAIAGMDTEIESITLDGLGGMNIVYYATAGDITAPSIVDTGASGSTYASATSVAYDDTIILADQDISKDPNYSGSQGAGAEFMQITTTINQTASKSDIQLRLDSLGITDSAFGDFSVDDTGLIIMQQDGVDYAIGQVAIARFTDNRGLEAVGDNLLKATTRSGTAIFNEDNDKMAEISGGSLELSTADLSESLVNLMVFQRAFEANAKSITTADQILTTLIQLKR